MSYTVELVPKAARSLSKLHRDIANRILKKLGEVKNEPFRYLEHYEGEDYYLNFVQSSPFRPFGGRCGVARPGLFLRSC